MNNEKFVLEQMKKLREIESRKDAMESMLLEVMKEKFPNVRYVNFGSNSIAIETEKHNIRMYSWGKLKETAPKFTCTEPPKMPDSIEEFTAMKNFVEDDYRQCYTAFFWLFNRYDFGYRMK